MVIYKLLRCAEWAVLANQGETLGAPVDVADGYVHFSTADQVVETAAKHFADAQDLLLLAVAVAPLGAALRWEKSRGGAHFPHLYRPLRLADVLWARALPLMAGAHLFPEDVVGHVDPARPQFEAFKSLDRDRPVEMLNLVRLRAQAGYPRAHPLEGQPITGAEAYAAYGRESAPVLARVGGGILWRGVLEAVLIGPKHEHWDHIFVARYPSAHAFLAMVVDADYRQAVVHRQAAVQTSRLLRCRPASSGRAFA